MTRVIKLFAFKGKRIITIQTIWWLNLFLITLFFHAKHILNSDEGVILEGAWNLLNGRNLYIDFFEFITPGSFYLVLWVWKIFGASYWIAKLLSILIIFFSAVGIYKISNKLIISKWNNLLPFIFIFSSFSWPIINHNTFNLFFIIWAIYFFILGLENNLRNNFIISGLFTGASILFSQQKGIIVLLTLSLFLIILLIKEKKYLWLKLNLYYLSASLLPILLLLLKWPPKLLYENLILFPIFNYAKVNIVPLYLLLIFLFVLLLEISLLRTEGSSKIWFLFLLQFILLLTTISRADYYHTTLIIFPIYVIIPLVWEKSRNLLIKNFFFLLIICLVFFILLTSIIHILYYPPLYSIKNDELMMYIKKYCRGEYLYAGPFLPSLYFEAKKNNSTPYPLLITNFNTPDQFNIAAESIKKNKPTCAILNFEMVKKFNYNKNNPVDNYIAKNYQLISRDSSTLIYKLKKN